MSEGNIDDRRSETGSPSGPLSPPPGTYHPGQSAYPPPPPSLAFPTGQPGVPVAGHPGPSSPAVGYPAPRPPAAGYPAAGYPGSSGAPQGYPAPGPQFAGHPGPGQPAAYAAQGYPAPGYPAQGYPVPGHPAYGYPAPGQPYAGYGAYAMVPPSGRRFWAMQFLYFIPFFGAIAVLIIALVQRSSTQRSPLPLVRENARWAANWALSFILYLVVLYGAIIAIGIGFGGMRSSEASLTVVIPSVLIYAIGIYCLVTIIIGTVKADRYVHRPFLALPFFRN